MPRPRRLLFPNAIYHVFNRGISKKTIIFSDYHKLLFIKLLDDISQKFNVKIHAYCLMTNHYHILIETPNANLDKAMHYLGRNLSLQINKSLNADGALFKDRYRSLLVDSDQYLLQVSRYIHLNPVEAGLVDHPEQYKWSSYNTYLSLDIEPFICTTKIFSYLKLKEDYRYFVNLGIDKEIKAFYSKKKKSDIIGSPHFISRFKPA
jgi:putative transposase